MTPVQPQQDVEKTDQSNTWPDPIRSAIQAHLQRTNLHLRHTGMPADERQEIVSALKTQVCEMLVQRCGDQSPSQSDLTEVLASVDPPQAYTQGSPTTRGLLRLLAIRLWVGHPWTVAVNDHGRRRIYWRRLALFFVALNLMSVLAICIFAWWRGDWQWVVRVPTAFALITTNTGAALGCYVSIGRVPVTDLPMPPSAPTNP